MFEHDFNFSKPSILRASNKEDQELGIDFWLCEIPVAHRKRRKKCPGDITIRLWRNSGASTEATKIIRDRCKADLFMFEFLDKVIFCSKKEIKFALITKKYKKILNRDGQTGFAAISLKEIKYMEWVKCRESTNKISELAK